MASASTGEAQQEKQGYKFIQFDCSTYAARLTLSHADYNVLTVPLMTEMATAIESLNGRADIKCIVLDAVQFPKARVKTFSAGISLEDSKPDRVFQTLDAFNRVFQALAEVSKPLIVVVNGQAVGAGSELVAFGDITTNKDVDMFAIRPPSGYYGPLTFRLQSAGLSLLAPHLSVLDAKGNVVWRWSNAEQRGLMPF